MNSYVINCVCSCAVQLTSFEELGVQVGQAAGDGVSEPAAADPIIGLDAQVATQGALKRTTRRGHRGGERVQTARDKRQEGKRWGRNLNKGDLTEKHRGKVERQYR